MAIEWAVSEGRFTSYRFSRDIQERLRELNRLDNWHGPVAFLSDAFWIAAPVAACYRLSFWFYPVAWLVVGSRMRALATLLHESAHGTLAANRLLNLALGTVLSAYPILQTHYPYKKSHVATHHPKLGRPDADPDLMYFIGQGVYQPGLSVRQRWLRLVVWPALGVRTLSFVKYLVVHRFKANISATKGAVSKERSDYRIKARRDKIAFALFWAVVFTILVLTGTLTGFVLFWVIPFLTSFQIISWFIELAEHTPLVRDNRVNLYMTRNRKSRGLERFLTAMHRENYHLDHHLDVRTPYWNMRKAHLLRLGDPRYADWDTQAGGLFTRGPQRQSPAIAAIVRDLGPTPRAVTWSAGEPYGVAETTRPAARTGSRA